MIEIEAPDGSVVEFPDGTPDNVITSAMQKAFPPQRQEQTSTGEALLRGGVKGATAGIGQTAQAVVRAVPELITGGPEAYYNEYRKLLGPEVERNKLAEQEHPTASMVGQVAGSAPMFGRTVAQSAITGGLSGLTSAPEGDIEAQAKRAALGTLAGAGAQKLGQVVAAPVAKAFEGVSKLAGGANEAIAKVPQLLRPALEKLGLDKETAEMVMRGEAGELVSPELLKNVIAGMPKGKMADVVKQYIQNRMSTGLNKSDLWTAVLGTAFGDISGGAGALGVKKAIEAGLSTGPVAQKIGQGVIGTLGAVERGGKAAADIAKSGISPNIAAYVTSASQAYSPKWSALTNDTMQTDAKARHKLIEEQDKIREEQEEERQVP